MNKQDIMKSKYYLQWGTHSKHMSAVVCSLMEHQSLVDLALCCGTNTIHAHKFILAANSPYFREQLEKNLGTEQVIITGIDFVILKSLIEFMYCGETAILEEHLKYLMAAAKFFQIPALHSLISDRHDIRYEADSIHIPAPIFLSKKPKYPNAYRPVSNNSVPPAPPTFNSFKGPISSDPYVHRKIKRKFVRSDAERACAKEAAASRLALEALTKELATTTQMNSFVIEESCTETTVENFIPHTDDNFIENVPLQVVNYNELGNPLLTTNQVLTVDKLRSANNMLQFGLQANLTKDKLKRLLGTDIPGNVEIMYRTGEGNFVSVTDDVFQNLPDGTLQYQIFDENGQVGEIREIEIQNPHSDAAANFGELHKTSPASIKQCDTNVCPDTSSQKLTITNSCSNDNDNLNFQETAPEIIDLCNKKKQAPVNEHSSIDMNFFPNSPPEVDSSKNEINGSDPFIAGLNETHQMSVQEKSVNLNDCDINKLLNLRDDVNDNVTENNHTPETHFELNDQQRNDQTHLKGSCKFGPEALGDSDLPLSDWYSTEDVTKQKVLGELDLTNDNILSGTSLNIEQHVEDGSGDHNVSLKKMKLSQMDKSPGLSMPSIMDEVVPWQMLEEDVQISPRRTRSTSRSIGNVSYTINSDKSNKNTVGIDDNQIFNTKYEKSRKSLPNRKKKSI